MTRMTGPDCAVMCNLINTHTHTHTHTHEHRMGTGTTITGTRIGLGRAEQRRKSARRHAGNGGDTGGKRKKCRKGRVGSVAANSDNLESNKKQGGEHKVLRAQVRFVQVGRVYPLFRV